MVRHLMRHVSTSAFLRHNAILFIGSLLVGALNYAYYPILARLLTVQAYGEVQTLMSSFVQLLIFLTVLGQVTVNVVANYQDEDQKQKVVYELEKLALLISLILFVIVALCSWKLKSFFHFVSVWPFIILMLSIVMSVPLAFRSAFLRAHKKFLNVSLGNMLGASSDIIFSIVLVWIGWSTVGAILGLVLAQLIAFLYIVRVARQTNFSRPSDVSLLTLPNVKLLAPELRYGGLVLCGSLIITVLSGADIFVVKHFFNATIAGRYAGVSTVARIVFFLTASVSQVLLPSVRIHQTAQENRQLFVKSLALVLALGGTATLIFALFPRLVITILMGRHYLAYSHLLGRLSLVMLVLSVLNLIISYSIALRRYQMAGIVIVGGLITFVLLAVRHQTLEAVITSLLYGSATMLGMFAIWSLFLSTNKMREGHEL
ncbi:MAG: oligosaccharide flippase family protein [Candidatus Saccharibacteria bacterium]